MKRDTGTLTEKYKKQSHTGSKGIARYLQYKNVKMTLFVCMNKQNCSLSLQTGNNMLIVGPRTGLCAYAKN